MSNQGFVVAEFPDGIQVIPKIWLQNKDKCKYPSHFKTDIKIRKAVEKQEIPKFDWPALEVIRIFGEYSSLQKAYAKAEKALYTSDMDTEKEAKYYRKHRARKIYSSSESEEESGVNLPPAPCPPAKRNVISIFIARARACTISIVEIVWISIRNPSVVHRGGRGRMEVWRLYGRPLDVLFRVGIDFV
ncbi:uncharacterized protein LOC114927940 [Nylanderia fulva]|uniref:uncharacterized protein LOC114927940 n=1 Tax=Nylanderia fulva TaxID=613905 RepID=UPI0010FB62C0|nr:uncharacterized protein LOC114927940 [Nylanderia fulva]